MGTKLQGSGLSTEVLSPDRCAPPRGLMSEVKGGFQHLLGGCRDDFAEALPSECSVKVEVLGRVEGRV